MKSIKLRKVRGLFEKQFVIFINQIIDMQIVSIAIHGGSGTWVKGLMTQDL